MPIVPLDSAMRIAWEHFAAGRLPQAESICRQVLASNPSFASALHLLGRIAVDTGHADDGIDLMTRALTADPGPQAAVVRVDLGDAFLRLGRRDHALQAYRSAIRHRPDYFDAYIHLAVGLRDAKEWDLATQACEAAAQLQPDNATAALNLGILYRYQARIDESLAALRRAVQLQPKWAEAGRNLLYTLHLHDGADAQAVFDEHRAWARQHAESLPRLTLSGGRDRLASRRRLRIGYVSRDFADHPVGRFLLPLLERHDRDAYEITCYADVTEPDAMTATFQSLAGIEWCDVTALDDAALAARIRDDDIDLLIDLAGHTYGNRLLAFARRPAPVQATWLGYPGTTGLSAMDYRITDAIADPPGPPDSLHAEKLIRPGGCFLCFRPPADAPEVLPPPAAVTGLVTFGSFNFIGKISPTILRLWAQILDRVPGSRLLIKSHVFDDPPTRERFRNRLATVGIAPDRTDLPGFDVTRQAHLAHFGKIDIALDTFPYHGTQSTCEALWMGVPVVALAGDRHASRVGASLLHAAGLDEFIATSPDQYVEIVCRLALHLPQLVELRQTMRQRLSRSALLDETGFARRMESAYRSMCGIPLP